MLACVYTRAYERNAMCWAMTIVSSTCLYTACLARTVHAIVISSARMGDCLYLLAEAACITGRSYLYKRSLCTNT